MEEIKQWIVWRSDLKVRKGKFASQVAHASMAFLVSRILSKQNGLCLEKDFSEEELSWLKGLFTKICLQVDSEQELKDIHEKAVAAGLTCHLIVDSGKTEFNGVPTPTALAIGPHQPTKVMSVVGHLKLY